MSETTAKTGGSDEGGAVIRQALPLPSAPLTFDELLALYAPHDRAEPRVRVNFVESLDGSATVDGLSGGLGNPADKRVFDILRGVADVVLVGAGTARAEGYGALTVTDELVAWRRSTGLTAQPRMALVSGRLELDPASDLFAKAPSRPLVFTTTAAPAQARERLGSVAELIDAGETRADPVAIVRELHARGLRHVLCEGGPSLFGDLVASDLVDELCLTVSPVLEGGGGRRITSSTVDASTPRGLELAHLLHSDSMLLTRWVRAGAR